jgi:hypothetical protein
VIRQPVEGYMQGATGADAEEDMWQMIQELWADRMQKGLFNYRLDDIQTKVVEVCCTLSC